MANYVCGNTKTSWRCCYWELSQVKAIVKYLITLCVWHIMKVYHWSFQPADLRHPDLYWSYTASVHDGVKQTLCGQRIVPLSSFLLSTLGFSTSQEFWVSQIIHQHNILQTDRKLHGAIVMKNGKQCRQIYEVETITEAISTRFFSFLMSLIALS